MTTTPNRFDADTRHRGYVTMTPDRYDAATHDTAGTNARLLRRSKMTLFTLAESPSSKCRAYYYFLEYFVTCRIAQYIYFLPILPQKR